MNSHEELIERLKPCPFCGSPAAMEPWHGGSPTKQMVSCADPDGECFVAPCVTGETPSAAVRKWNTRAALESNP